MPTPNKLALVKQLVESAKNNLETANQLLMAMGAAPMVTAHSSAPVTAHIGGGVQHTDQGAVIIEGVFDGQNMVGPDGKLYSVPANYASKSKLVEGDLLKLTISPDGSFIYKQIGPVERDRIVGVLVKDPESEDFAVMAQGRNYKVLLASITYFKSEVGDEVVILVPKGSASTWAAVENVIKRGESDSMSPALAQVVTRAPLTIAFKPEFTVKKTEPKSKLADKAMSAAVAHSTVEPALVKSASRAEGAPAADKVKAAFENKSEMLPPLEI